MSKNLGDLFSPIWVNFPKTESNKPKYLGNPVISCIWVNFPKTMSNEAKKTGQSGYFNYLGQFSKN